MSMRAVVLTHFSTICPLWTRDDGSTSIAEHRSLHNHCRVAWQTVGDADNEHFRVRGYPVTSPMAMSPSADRFVRLTAERRHVDARDEMDGARPEDQI